MGGRRTDSQIIGALQRFEAGLLVPELCREYGISTTTFNKCAKFGGMDTSMMARMKELEDEKLKSEIGAEALAKSGKAV